MSKNLLTLGLVLALATAALPGLAYHIADCDTSDGITAPGCDELQAADPTEWGAQVGATFPIGDDNLCPAGSPSPPCPVGTGPICVLIGGALGTVISQVPPELQPLAIEAGTIVYDLVCPDGYILDWNQNDPILGFTACENNGTDPDPVTGEPGTPSRQGQGGLCFMNPGFEDDGLGACVFAKDTANPEGNSNGNYDPYDATLTGCNAAATAQPVIQDVSRQWYEIRMFRDASNQVDFTAQIDGVSCTDSTGALATSGSVVYDEQFAYMVDSGHVSGFPVTGPSPTGHYDVTSVTGPGSLTGCNGPEPWYQ